MSEGCKRYYFWAVNSCVVNSGEGTAAVGSGKWYVNFNDFKCVKDCIPSVGDINCGGLAQAWDILYETSDQCCKLRLSWIDRDECTAML